MSRNELIEVARLRVRKLKDGLDDDMATYIDFAIADLKRIGVNEKHLESVEDPIVLGAILAYVKAYYGMDAYHEKWLAAYDSALTKIKGGDYK
jgi:hypothetical protein